MAVADVTALDFDPHPAGGGLGDFTFNDCRRSARTGDLCSTHLWHDQVFGMPFDCGEFRDAVQARLFLPVIGGTIG